MELGVKWCTLKIRFGPGEVAQWVQILQDSYKDLSADCSTHMKASSEYVCL